MSAQGRHRLHRQRRSGNRPLLGAAAAAALLPMLATPYATAAGVLPEGPLTVRTISPVPGTYINETLQGAVCAAPNTCAPIPYISFITPIGVNRLNEFIKEEADGPTVIYAYSNGAQVAQHWITQHADDPDAPPAGDVSFILMGNSTRKYGGADKEFGVSQPSQYKVIDIAREYDPVADFPDHPLNVLALANALVGFITLHDYRDIDIEDPDNIVWTEGNTTYVLVPTENLPLLDPLRLVGLNQLADQLNGPLKEIVDRGYDRSYIPTTDPEPDATATATANPAGAPVTTLAAKRSPLPSVPSDIGSLTGAEPTPEHEDATPPAGPATSARLGGDDVADAMQSATKTAKRELDNLTKPLRSLRPPRFGSDNADRKLSAKRGDDSADRGSNGNGNGNGGE